MRKDERYKTVDILESDVKKRIFDTHIRVLQKKRYEQLKQILAGMCISICLQI
jgi:hypothetical protein